MCSLKKAILLITTKFGGVIVIRYSYSGSCGQKSEIALNIHKYDPFINDFIKNNDIK